MKILVSDKVDRNSLDLFLTSGIRFDYLPEITPPQLLGKIPLYHALMVRSRTKVTKDVIKRAKLLKIIGRVGSGIDNIDINSCKVKKIKVTNAKGANSNAVAEHTIALILSALRHIPKAHQSTKKGQWLKKELVGNELKGKIVGIAGFGFIGKRVEKLVKAFGAKSLIWSRSKKTCSLKKLFSASDIITIHLALTNETKGLVNTKLFSLMKKSAIVINTSRGQIIKENDLYQVLKSKKIASAALDVFWQEPIPKNSKWLKLDNCLFTPHIAASTKEALKNATIMVVKDIKSFLKGGSLKNRIY